MELRFTRSRACSVGYVTNLKRRIMLAASRPRLLPLLARVPNMTENYFSFPRGNEKKVETYDKFETNFQQILGDYI